MPRRNVILQPVTMLRPNAQFIYAPSKLRPVKRISEREFVTCYAGSAQAIQVSFEADGVSNPQPVTAYGRGLDCWYIVS
jgi:hypothetical protein